MLRSPAVLGSMDLSELADGLLHSLTRAATACEIGTTFERRLALQHANEALWAFHSGLDPVAHPHVAARLQDVCAACNDRLTEAGRGGQGALGSAIVLFRPIREALAQRTAPLRSMRVSMAGADHRRPSQVSG